MTTSAGCTITQLTLGPTTFDRKPFGSEPGWPTKQPRCGDCGVTQGSHHHLGCDIAQCPKCHGQLLSCGCAFTEYGVDNLFWLMVDDETDDSFS